MATSPASSPRRAAVVYNPIKVDLDALKVAVQEAESGAGWGPTLWFPTSEDDGALSVTREAVAEGVQVIMAAGGDGTVREVAEALRDSDVAIALIPSGTGNLLARNLALPLTSVTDSIDIAFSGEDHRIDLGMVKITRDDGATEEHAFLVMAGLGLDAKMIAKTSSKLKKAVGWLAYVEGIGRALPEIHPVRLKYKLDGAAERELTAHTVLIGNCGTLPGGILLIPDAKPDDGVLDIVALRPRGPFGWLKVWNKITWENGVLRKSAIGRQIIDLRKDVRDVLYVTGKDLVMTVASPEEFQLDGDEFGEVKSVHSWVDPGALLIKLPVTV